MLNDVHCHFFSPRFFETLARQKGWEQPTAGQEAVRVLGWDDPVSADALADRWVQELSAHGVTRAMLIASVPGDEASVAAAIARHPSRFAGAFMLDPTARDGEARLADALDAGLQVACLFPAMHGYSLTELRVERVADAVAARSGRALFVHCGVLSVGVRKKLGLPSVFEFRYGNPLDLQGLAARHPSLPILIPHFGAGFFREALMVADSCANVHLDTSSSNSWTKLDPGLTLERVFRQALAVVGPSRLVFGTDSSFFPRGWQRAVYDSQQGLISALDLTEDDREAIFARNFDRLLPPATAPRHA
jgi:predicted TIM-barrel fold metal-dependent hydrolase